MHTALNKTLAAVPDDTVVYVSFPSPLYLHIRSPNSNSNSNSNARYHTISNHKKTNKSSQSPQPGHEYTKANVKFAASISQSKAVKALQEFAEKNQQTHGKFTIADEKKHNVFMRVDDPEIQKATGEMEPVKVMKRLREMKNGFK